MPNFNPKQTRGHSLLVWVLSAALISMLLMFVYEDIKQHLLPNLSLWESHLITIGFTSLLASLATYIGRKLTLTNERLESRIVERTADLTQLNARLEAERRILTALSRMSEFLQSCQQPEELGVVIQEFATQVFSEGRGSVSTISESRNIVEAIAVWGDPPMGSAVFAPDDCWALRMGRLHVVETQTGMFCRHTLTNSPRTSLCVPLMAHGETLGLLHLEDVRAEMAGPGLALAIGGHAALAIANLRLRNKLRNQAIRDDLTGLFNRRFMEESLECGLRRAIRRNRPLSVIMLDLDHFKNFNDTSGHAAGDAVLRAVGNVLLTFIRGEDIACRYGGEEFMVILEETTLEVARTRAEEVRESLKSLNLQNKDQPLGIVTASMGVSAYPEHGDSSDSLLRAADAALYQAKEEGRDRVIVSANPAGAHEVLSQPANSKVMAP